MTVAGDPKHIPEAWPRLLSRDQLCAYVGCSEVTLAKICPVQPRDMGANIVRYDRLQIDAWADGLPPRLTPRLQGARQTSHGASAGDGPGNDDVSPEAADDRPSASLDRVRARASGGATRWKRTG